MSARYVRFSFGHIWIVVCLFYLIAHSSSIVQNLQVLRNYSLFKVWSGERHTLLFDISYGRSNNKSKSPDCLKLKLIFSGKMLYSHKAINGKAILISIFIQLQLVHMHRQRHKQKVASFLFLIHFVTLSLALALGRLLDVIYYEVYGCLETRARICTKTYNNNHNCLENINCMRNTVSRMASKKHTHICDV